MKPHNPPRTPAAPACQPDVVRGVLICGDAWFDLNSAGCQLRIAISSPVSLDEFAAPIEMDGQTVWVHFGFLAFIQGRHIFEAIRLHSEPSQVPSLPNRSYRLSGPFQGGRPVAS